MKIVILILSLLLLISCNKAKTVLICGDHVCVNKAEAEQYFEDNLSLEVRLIDKKKSDKINLVELNMKKNLRGEKEIKIFKKKETKEKIKTLSTKEIKKKKIQLKKIKKQKKLVKKIKNKQKTKKLTLKNKETKKSLNPKKIVNNSNSKIVDVCTILVKCSIEEISKYLIKQGKNKKYPDITMRE